MQQLQQRKSTLGFARITADDARQQRERIAQQLAAQIAQHPPAPPLPQKRPVGRPKRQRDAADVLAAAAAATAIPLATIAPMLPLDHPEQARQVHQLVRAAVPSRHPRRVLAMPQCTNSGDLLTPRTSRRTLRLTVPRHDAGMVRWSASTAAAISEAARPACGRIAGTRPCWIVHPGT